MEDVNYKKNALERSPIYTNKERKNLPSSSSTMFGGWHAHGWEGPELSYPPHSLAINNSDERDTCSLKSQTRQLREWQQHPHIAFESTKIRVFAIPRAIQWSRFRFWIPCSLHVSSKTSLKLRTTYGHQSSSKDALSFHERWIAWT